MPSAILLVGDSVTNPNLYYKTRFLAGDPFVYFETEEGPALLIGGFEFARAQKESSVPTVKNYDAYGYRDLVKELGDRNAAFEQMLQRAVKESGADRIIVEGDFPVALADMLRESGVTLQIEPELFVEERRIKSEAEVEAIATAQRAAERAIGRAVEMLAGSEIRDGTLVYEGEPLTAERLREAIEISLLRDGMGTPQGAIVAPGPGAADPHWEGTGPIRAGEAVVMDIFPQGKESRYFGDVTRTVVKGTPSETLRAMYDAVLRAQEAALATIRAGVTGQEVHAAVERIFEEAGFAGEGSGPRYIHGTGHGVGLEVHEEPSLGANGRELKVGDVVTVEPGLYDPEIGAVRIEDTVVVTEDGCRNLNSFPKQFEV